MPTIIPVSRTAPPSQPGFYLFVGFHTKTLELIALYWHTPVSYTGHACAPYLAARFGSTPRPAEFLDGWWSEAIEVKAL